MQTFFQDLRYGARLLLRNKSFSLIAILTLALGIGANTAIFSIVQTVLLQPLPFPNSERIMAIGSVTENASDTISYPDFTDLRGQSNAFGKMAVYSTRGYIISGADETVRMRGAIVTADLFSVLGVKALYGQTFSAEADKAGGGRSVVLSYSLWEKRFKSDQSVVGKAVTINAESYLVTGVMPPEFHFPIQAEPIELWANYAKDCEDNGKDSSCTQRGNQYLRAVGLLKPEISLTQAKTQLATIASQLQSQYPNDHKDFVVSAIPLLQLFTGDVSNSLWVLFAAVSFVLLIACANVANLLLSRNSSRTREIAVRTALGAGRWRMMRQLLTESLLLSLLGGIAAWGLAGFLIEALIAITPDAIPRIAEARLDWRVLLFTFAAVVLTGFIVGLIPALQATKLELHSTLKEAGRGTTGARGLARSAFVVAVVSLAVILLLGAGLLIQSFVRLTRVKPGFNSEHILTMRVALPDGIYAKPEQIAGFYQRLMSNLASLPGVASYSGVTPLPFSNSFINVGFNIEGRPNNSGRDAPYDAQVTLVGTDYFQTLGLALKQGRVFEPRDQRTAPQVVMVNEAFVKKFFPNENPIGKKINPTIQDEEGPLPMREIIGVVNDSHSRNLQQPPAPELYLHIPQLPAMNVFTLVLKTQAAPQTLTNLVRQEIAKLDRNVSVGQIRILDEYIQDSVAEPRFNSLLLGVFAATALLLTAIGLYGVVAYSVTQRTQEIGIRMALGARAADVLQLIVGQGMKLVLIGLGLGIAGAFALTRLMESLLYEVHANDPLTFTAIAAILLIVAVIACWLPARRATKVDPMIALRCE